MTFDLQLLDDHSPGNTAKAWEIEVGRDSTGLNRGLGAELRVLADGTMEVETGAGVVAVPAIATGEWVEVTTTLDYTTKTVDLSIGGVVVVSDAPFDRDRADNFGSLQFQFAAPAVGDHRQIGFDNIRFASSSADTLALLVAGVAEDSEAGRPVAFRPIPVDSAPFSAAASLAGPLADRQAPGLRTRLLLIEPSQPSSTVGESPSDRVQTGEPTLYPSTAVLREAFASIGEENPDPFEEVSL